MAVRVLVLWADNESANLGVRALASGTEAVATRIWGPETEVVLQDFKGLSSGIPITRASLLRAYILRRGPLIEFLRTFDVVIDTGAGDSFADIYGMKRLAAIIGVQRIIDRLGIPLLMGPQTIGPFQSKLGAHLAAKSLRNAAVVLARDHTSQKHADALGGSNVQSATDVVFAIEESQSALTDEHDVLFNVSGLLWVENPHVPHERYREAVSHTIDELLRLGRSVTLLAHVLDSPYADNDVPAVQSIFQQYDGLVRLVVPKTLEEARATIRNSHAVVASRMHAALNAISQSVPTVPWAYSRKFAPLLEDMGINWSVDLRELRSTEVVTRTLHLIEGFTTPEEIARLRRARATTSEAIDALVATVRQAQLVKASDASPNP